MINTSILRALKKLSSPESTVIRDGKRFKVKSSDLVIGDIVVLEDDDFIDFLKTEKFNSTEKSILPLINPRVDYFPEVLTSTAQEHLLLIERKLNKKNR